RSMGPIRRGASGMRSRPGWNAEPCRSGRTQGYPRRLSPMHEFIIEAIARGGYWGIAVLMAIEHVFPPIPSEVIMGIGGVLVARGSMEFWPLLAAGTVGSTLGNYVWYWIGDKWGYRRLEPFVARRGRWLTVEWEDIENATRFFQRHGQWVVLF